MRGTGWKPWHALGRTAANLLASDLHLRNTVGQAFAPEIILPRAVWVPDQDAIRDPKTGAGSEACAGFMGARLSYAFDGVQVSGAMLWYHARRYDNPRIPLANVGVSMAGMLHAFRDHGAPPINPELEPGMYDEPSAIYRMAGQRRNLDIVPLWGTGKEVVDGVCGALSDGLPCGIAIHADDVYQNPVNGYVGPEVNPEAGGHAVVIWGYRTSGGKRQFWSPGSWGTSWRGSLGGCVWLDESRIANASFACLAKGIS